MNVSIVSPLPLFELVLQTGCFLDILITSPLKPAKMAEWLPVSVNVADALLSIMTSD